MQSFGSGRLLFYSHGAAWGHTQRHFAGRVGDPISSHLSGPTFMSDDDFPSLLLGMIPGYIYTYLKGGGEAS